MLASLDAGAETWDHGWEIPLIPELWTEFNGNFHSIGEFRH